MYEFVITDRRAAWALIRSVVRLLLTGRIVYVFHDREQQ